MRCILFCDIVRYTPQSVQARRLGVESELNDRLVHFMSTSRDLLREHGATFVKLMGDGLLATSPDPMGMVRAIQKTRKALESDGSPFSVRAGLHVGSVAVDADEDVLGADAALGQRVMAEARAGQVFVSETCASHLRPYLPAGTSLHDMGERHLKGFDSPVRLYQLHLPGLAWIDTRVEPAPMPAAQAPIRLLLADDERLLRDALATLLKLEPDFDLVGQASNGLMAVEGAKTARPDVVLTDIEMPKMDGIEATRAIKETCPDTEICILTKFGDDARLFAAIRAGAIGYMLKDSGVEEIGPVVRAVYRKEGFLSPALVPRVMAEFSRLSGASHSMKTLFADLTRREAEVLELVGAGMRNRSIADKLFISDKTVKNHVSNILAKLQVNDRTEAALLARDGGLITAA